MKNYKIWLRAASIIQILTALLHAVTLFVNPPINNDTEQKLYELMSTYQFDLGVGFLRTMNDMTLALSSCLSFLCIFAGLTNLFLMRKQASVDLIKGILHINLLVFGFFFVITLCFTFLLPIIQIGLIVLCLMLARLTIKRESK